MKKKLQKSKIALLFKFIKKYLKDTTLEDENEKLRELNNRLTDLVVFWETQCHKKDEKIVQLKKTN